MANTIRIGTFEVSSFKVGLKDPKIYLGDILLYPTGGYKVCYAVVDDISQYSDTEFEDVYDKATEKWYKLNNLNQYEEYGIYGSGRNITYYNGKLTIDDEASSRLPQGYTEVEYVENTSTAYIDTGEYLNTSNFEVGYTFWGNRAQWGYVHQNVANGAWITTANDYAYMGRFDSSYRVAISSYLTSDENTIVYTQSGVTVNGTSISKNLNLSGTDNLNASTLLFFVWYDFYRAGVEHSFNSKVKSFYLKNNGILVRDFVPAKRNSDNKYGMYDLVTDTFYLSPNNVDFSGGDPATPTKTYEYIYSGGSWVNLGEVSGSSKTSDFKIGDIDNPITSDASLVTDGMYGIILPVSLSANTSSAVALMGSSNSNTLSNLSSHTKTSVISENDIIDYAVWKFYGTTTANTFYVENVATKKYFGYSNVSISYMPLVDESSKVPTVFSAFTKDNVTALGICKGNTPNQYYAINDLHGRHYQYNWFNLLSDAGDLNNSYVIYKLKGGEPEYPVYYDEIQDPPDNLVFSSMAEAEAYECPWVGMHATINGDKYVFSGDSQSGYEWVEIQHSLPDVPFTVNYNAKQYNASTKTLLKTEGQLADVDAVITAGTPTVNDGYLTIASSTRATISGYQNYFNRSNSTPNLTIISKQRTDGNNGHMFTNRDSDSNYNWMYRCYSDKLTLHGTSEQGSVTVTTQPVIESVRVNSSRLATYNNYTNNTSSTYSNFSYGGTNSGKFALFAGIAQSTSEWGEWFVGDFYWVYMCQGTLTDEQVQQVIDYNENL